jgi:hypothetical protein
MNKTGIFAAVLLVAIAGTLYFTALKSEKDLAIIPNPQPEIQKTVVWYTSLPESNAERIANAFELKYNNTIRVEVVRGATYDMSQKILDEIANENVSAKNTRKRVSGRP